MKKLGLLTVAAMILGAQVASAECVVTIDRKPCPGKEVEAFKPYAGKNPTEDKTKATSADACKKDAEKESKIIRKGKLAEKKVTAKFDGAEVFSSTDKSECK